MVVEEYKSLTDRFFLTANPYLKILVVLLLLIGAYLRLSHPGACYFNEFTERDWYRTYEIYSGKRLHTTGSELSQGGRIPGAWMYWLQMIPMTFSRDPISLFYYIGILNIVALYFCYRFGAKFFGVTAGIIALGLFAVFPLANIALRYLWNPALLFPFVIITLYCLASSISNPRPKYLYTSAVTVILSINCHISGMYLLLLTIVFLLLFRPKHTKKHYCIALIIIVAMFLPFFLGEVFNGFENLKPMLMKSERLVIAGYDRPNPVTQRYRFNRASWEAFMFNVYPRLWGDQPYFGAFSYYALFIKQFPEYFSSFSRSFLEGFLGFVPIHLVVYILAIAYGLHRLIVLAFKKRPGKTALKGALFLILMLPAIVLFAQLFLVFIQSGDKPESGARYFFIIAPTQFLIIGLLISGAIKTLKNINAAKVLIGIICATLGVWIVSQAIVVEYQLNWSSRSGYFMQFQKTPVVNLATSREIVDVLVNRLGITRETYITHVQPLDYIINYDWGTESGLDFLLNIHPKVRGYEKDEGASSNGRDIATIERDVEQESTKQKFVYIIDRSLPHPDLSKYTIEQTIDIGPISLCISPDGTPEPLRKHHRMLNPFIHFDK